MIQFDDPIISFNTFDNSLCFIPDVYDIDLSIQNVINDRKNKRINYKTFCSKIKALTNKRKRQIKRQYNFYNKYSIKYDYYYPLIDMKKYIDVFYNCRKTTSWKRIYQLFNMNLLKNIGIIHYDMINNYLNTSPHKHFKINERGKIRDISAPDIKERLIQSNLSTNIAHPLTDHTLIYDNYASQLNKGVHVARKRYKTFLIDSYKLNKTKSYILKLDIHHFFDSVNHAESMNIWNRYIKNKYTLNIISQILNKKINNNGVGLCLGSEISQLTATLYLSKLDHIIKERFRIKYYGRYNDDICIIHESKEYLLKILKTIIYELEQIGLKINETKTKILNLVQDSFEILKTKYFYDKYKCCGKVIMLSGRKSSKRERRKLRKFKNKFESGEMKFKEIFNLYKSWRKNILKSFNSYNLISRNDEYFKNLFGLKYANFKNNNYIFK